MKFDWNAFTILVLLATLFSIAGIIKPAWPMVQVAILLVCIALLIGKAQ